MPDSQKRTFELHSPDSKHFCILRCTDEQESSLWISAIHSNLTILTQIAISEANNVLNTSPGQVREVRHMGWLAEQVIR